MKKISLFFYLLSCSLLISCQSNHSAGLTFDFKNSQLQSEGWIVNTITPPETRIDSTEEVNGKHPLVIEQTKYQGDLAKILPKSKRPLLVSFYRQISLSGLSNSIDTVTVNISNKSLNLSEAIFKIFCIDKEDDVILCDSININNENRWNTESISFPVNKIQRIIMGVFALGYDLPSPNAYNPQKLWLDKINLRTKGQILNPDNQQQTLQEKIDSGHAIKINPLDSQLSKINISDDKRIIGIGEAVYGSETIDQIETELVKNIILHDSCRLVLFEGNMSQIMIWNQFVQGKTSEDYIDEIKKDLSFTTLRSSEIIGDFLIWLRNYNNTSNEKVYIQGLTDYYNKLGNYFFQYAYTYLNNSTSPRIVPLLKKLTMTNQNFPEALSYVQESKSSLETIMGNKEFANFLYALEKAAGDNKVDSSNENRLNLMYHKLLQRNISMSENINRLVSLYLRNNQKACIIAHNGLINKKLCNDNFPYLYSMGYYLHQTYGDRYYALGIFPGEGSMAVLADRTDSVLMKKVYLKPLLSNSLEYACSQSGLASFFYSTEYLKNNLFHYRSIRGQYPSEEYESGNLKTQMDGFIFVDKIQSVQTDSLSADWANYIMERMKKEADFLRTYSK